MASFKIYKKPEFHGLRSFNPIQFGEREYESTSWGLTQSIKVDFDLIKTFSKVALKQKAALYSTVYRYGQLKREAKQFCIDNPVKGIPSDLLSELARYKDSLIYLGDWDRKAVDDLDFLNYISSEQSISVLIENGQTKFAVKLTGMFYELVEI